MGKMKDEIRKLNRQTEQVREARTAIEAISEEREAEDARRRWLTDPSAHETTIRLLHKQFPDSATYAAQARLFDENARLRAEIKQVANETLERVATKIEGLQYNAAKDGEHLRMEPTFPGIVRMIREMKENGPSLASEDK